jgi:hypothetical protein
VLQAQCKQKIPSLWFVCHLWIQLAIRVFLVPTSMHEKKLPASCYLLWKLQRVSAAGGTTTKTRRMMLMLLLLLLQTTKTAAAAATARTTVLTTATTTVRILEENYCV